MTAARRAASRSDETQLVQRVADGDLSALGELYDRYAEDVRRFAFRATGHVDVAEDVTHDAFVELVEAAKRFDARCSVRAFVVGIAGKLVLRRRRRSAIFSRVLAAFGEQPVTRHERTPEGEASDEQQLARYRRALARLSDAKRVTVVMADVEGLTGPEIAAALDVPLGTVWTRLHHARAELQHAMQGGAR